MGTVLVEYWPYCNLLGSLHVWHVQSINHAITIHKTLQKDAPNVRERLGQNETFSWEKGTMFSDTLLRKKRRQFEPNRPLSDWSSDWLVMSHNQLGKRATCPFIFFIENPSRIAIRMANFNFLAQLIITTILFSLRFARQNKSPNSIAFVSK